MTRPKRTSMQVAKSSSTESPQPQQQPSKDDFDVIKLISNGAYGWVCIRHVEMAFNWNYKTPCSGYLTAMRSFSVAIIMCMNLQKSVPILSWLLSPPPPPPHPPLVMQILRLQSPPPPLQFRYCLKVWYQYSLTVCWSLNICMIITLPPPPPSVRCTWCVTRRHGRGLRWRKWANTGWWWRNRCSRSSTREISSRLLRTPLSLDYGVPSRQR